MPRWQASLLLALLLGLSLTLKSMGGFELTEIIGKQDPTAFLQSIGFREDAPARDDWIQAARPGCSIEVLQVSHQGWERDAVTEYAGARRHFYSYGGERTREHPLVRALFAFYLARLQAYLHLPFSTEPIWAVVENPNCPAELFAVPGTATG